MHDLIIIIILEAWPVNTKITIVETKKWNTFISPIINIIIVDQFCPPQMKLIEGGCTRRRGMSYSYFKLVVGNYIEHSDKRTSMNQYHHEL